MPNRDQEFTRLVAAEGRKLLAFTRRSCGDGTDAEDVVQEAFALAFGSWHQLAQAESARAWLEVAALGYLFARLRVEPA